MLQLTDPKQANVYIAYGSESGNAKKLASRLNEVLQDHQPKFFDLNSLPLTDLTMDDTLLIISSSFGDGEPPANGAIFFDHLHELSDNEIQPWLAFDFAIFGLGDVSYPKFCGFTMDVDKKLCELGATSIAQRVDADTSYQDFFTKWSVGLTEYFSGNNEPLKALDLQVKAYGEDQSYPATMYSVKRINQVHYDDDGGQVDFPVYDIQINIKGSGINYKAGDLLYVLPPVNQLTFERVLRFFTELSGEVQQQLQEKELRQLTKPLIRAFAKKTKNLELKALTKMSASKQLAEYIYGRDVADLLDDYCTPETMPVDVLLDILSAISPRAYSIASCGSASPNLVRLCIREVNYQLNNVNYTGSGSHFLCHATDNKTHIDKPLSVRIYVRANVHFHLPEENSTPIIMIGSGTGIAPYMGFLSSEQANQRTGEAHLFFGERYGDTDYLYKQELQEHSESGHLTSIHTAFSRDQEEKFYVQDALIEQGKTVWQLLEKNAEIYVCGSKKNLSKPIDNALINIAQTYGKLDEEQAKKFIHELSSEQRYHQDLY